MKLRPVMLVAALALAAGCAAPPRDPAALAIYRANHDPLEPMNRKIFTFNQKVDQYLIKPAAKAYLKLPRALRLGVRDVIQNLNEPVVFANNILQGRFHRANITSRRFILNSTFGLAGIMDYASQHGLPVQIGDFGQTLYVWRVPEGPYLVLPLLGPSNPRDGIGTGVDVVLDPLRYLAHTQTSVSIAQAVAQGIDERARNLDALDEIQKESIDFYATLRSLYRQNRAAELNNNQPPATPVSGASPAPAAAPAGPSSPADAYPAKPSSPATGPSSPADNASAGPPSPADSAR